MLKDLRNYILEKDFRINIVDGKIDIVNYKTIDHFDDKRINSRALRWSYNC